MADRPPWISGWLLCGDCAASGGCGWRPVCLSSWHGAWRSPPASIRAALAPAPGPLVLDRDGQILRLGLEAQGRKLITLPAAELPEKVAAAFIAAEDQRFWRHPGVDPLAVLRALAGNVSAGHIVSGASTITMQLARLTFTEKTKNPGPRTYWRKLMEMVRSLRMEWSLSKPQILRCYLDRVPMGNNLMGVETAARLYFGKTTAQLSIGEAALLAALVRAPGTLNPYGPAPGPATATPGTGALAAGPTWQLKPRRWRPRPPPNP